MICSILSMSASVVISGGASATPPGLARINRPLSGVPYRLVLAWVQPSLSLPPLDGEDLPGDRISCLGRDEHHGPQDTPDVFKVV